MHTQRGANTKWAYTHACLEPSAYPQDHKGSPRTCSSCLTLPALLRLSEFTSERLSATYTPLALGALGLGSLVSKVGEICININRRGNGSPLWLVILGPSLVF